MGRKDPLICLTYRDTGASGTLAPVKEKQRHKRDACASKGKAAAQAGRLRQNIIYMREVFYINPVHATLHPDALLCNASSIMRMVL